MELVARHTTPRVVPVDRRRHCNRHHLFLELLSGWNERYASFVTRTVIKSSKWYLLRIKPTFKRTSINLVNIFVMTTPSALICDAYST
eukprot:scaffold20693_cov134-Skeletonema_dohrnii-CCMP3373.AAC.2